MNESTAQPGQDATSFRLLSTMLDAAGKAIIATDSDGRVLYWSKAATDLYGWSSDEVLGRDLVEFIIPADSRDATRERRRRLFEQPLSVSERTVQHRDGRQFQVEITNTLLRDEQDRVAGFVGISTDVTERSWAEAERVRLIESEREARAVAERARDRSERLQRVTAALAAALSIEDVRDIVVTASSEALGARSAFLCIPTDDGRFLKVTKVEGFPPEVGLLHQQFPLESDSPICRAFRTLAPVFLHDRAAWDEQFSEPPFDGSTEPFEANVAVPLFIRGRALGALALRFAEGRQFPREDRELILTLVQQCAEGMERSRLYAVERSARLEAERIQDELRASEDRWRTFIETAPESMIITGPDGTILLASERSAYLFGYSSNRAMLGVPGMTLYSEDNPPELLVALAKLAATGGQRRVRVRLRRYDGTEFEGEVTCSVVWSPESTTPHTLWITRDMTEIVAADRIARRYATIVQSTDDAIIATDARGVVTNWNRGATRLYGYSAREMVGSSLERLTPSGEEADSFSPERWESDRSRYQNADATHRRANGSMVDVSVTVSPLKSSSGEIDGAVIIARDSTAQKAHHRALLQSEERYRQLIDASPDGVMVSNVQHRVLQCNARAAQMLGVGDTSDLLETIAPSVALEFGINSYGRDQRRLEWTESKVEFEATVDRADGSSFDADIVCQPLPGSTNEGRAYISILRDISARRRSEEEIRRYVTIVRASSAAIISYDVHGTITTWNPAAERLYGYLPEEAIGRADIPAWPADRAVEHSAVWKRAIGGESVADTDSVSLHKDGRPIDIAISLSPIRDGTATIVGVASISRYTGDRVAAMASLRRAQDETWRSREQLRLVLETMTDAVVMTDTVGTFTYLNAAAERAFGVSRLQLLGTPVLSSHWVVEAVAASATGRSDFPLVQALSLGIATSGRELQVRGVDGEKTCISLSCAPIRDTHGIVIGAVMSFSDITERMHFEEARKKEAELVEQNSRMREVERLKSQFLANMSHELRTPLNAIIGFAELLHEGRIEAGSQEYTEYAGDILTSGWHLLQIVNDVLDLSKIEAGKLRFNFERVDVPAVVQEAVDIVRAMALAKHIRVSVETAHFPEPVRADALRLKQVLYNYLSNAIKFTPHDGEVTIRAYPQDESHYRVEVEDTGTGIPAEDIPFLFQDFYQSELQSEQAGSGTGLGLAITKRIVEAHGGHVGVESTVGKCSIFFAVLPQVAHEGEKATRRGSRAGA